MRTLFLFRRLNEDEKQSVLKRQKLSASCDLLCGLGGRIVAAQRASIDLEFSSENPNQKMQQEQVSFEMVATGSSSWFRRLKSSNVSTSTSFVLI